MTGEFAARLSCPLHGTPITVAATMLESGVPWPNGTLTCPSGCRFPIVGGIPRFSRGEKYANAFGAQWRRYQRTQLDSHTGAPLSRERLERCLGMPLSQLAGKTVLECGVGAGRFTELLAAAAGSLVALDHSDAVDANLKTGAGNKPYLLLQADLNRAPLPKRAFDFVICLGVVQHTPSPEQSIASLAEHVNPGGMLVFEHYAKRGLLGAASQYLTLGLPLREVFKRLDPQTGLRATIALSALCDPIRKRTSRFKILDLLASRLLPTACYYGMLPKLSDEMVREWNELDTHDGLTAWYKHQRSPAQIKAHLQSLGLRAVHCERGGNGIEVRALRP